MNNAYRDVIILEGNARMTPSKHFETLAHGYSSESTQRELSYEYPHDLVRIIFMIFYFLRIVLEESSLSLGRVKPCPFLAPALINSYDRLDTDLV